MNPVSHLAAQLSAPTLAWMRSVPALQPWADRLLDQFVYGLDPKNCGDLPVWLSALNSLPPDLTTSSIDFTSQVRIGTSEDLAAKDRLALQETLMALHPWRKGPFYLFGLHLDTEWRSDWKWDRILPHISPLQGRRVLDIGCGNGYHLWRMLGAGASRVVGIDPTIRFWIQFLMIQKLAGEKQPIDFIPIGIESVPTQLQAFDTVFSMGVLYHRRSPIDHLLELKQVLRPEGELVLETLIVEGDSQTVLVPSGRYGKMPNVWFIPSIAMLEIWLHKCGFRDIHCVDQTPTLVTEQRQTEWMTFESLSDFLDQDNPNQTIEGYPAPIRATFVAKAPRGKA